MSDYRPDTPKSPELTDPAERKRRQEEERRKRNAEIVRGINRNPRGPSPKR